MSHSSRRQEISTVNEARHRAVPMFVAPVHQVSIYITAHCANCDHAWEVAKLIRDEYPQVLVAIIDLADPQEPVPDAVFATPTYLLDGHLWSLGNPSLQQVHDRLSGLED